MAVDPSYGLQQEMRPKRPRWGPWATLGWGAVIGLVYLVTQLGAAFAFIFWWENAFPDQPLDLSELASNGPVLGTVTLVSTAAVIGVVLLAVKLSRVPVADYLALKWPSWRSLIIGVLLTAVVLPAADFATVQAGHDAVPDFMTDIYVSSQEAGTAFSVLLALTLVVLAPLGEEVVFRGFFFRGLNAGLGPFLAIVTTALIWSTLHIQYEPIFMGQIFVYGVLLGWMRWRSGSLVLAIVLHAVINGLALVQVTMETSA